MRTNKPVHTHQHYHPGCPDCERNLLFIQVITQKAVTQEAYDRAVAAYRTGDATKLQELKGEGESEEG